jgi:hypothetical protein
MILWDSFAHPIIVAQRDVTARASTASRLAERA